MTAPISVKLVTDDVLKPILNRGGVRVEQIDLSDANLAGGVDLGKFAGHGIMMLKQGSHPGARLALSFSGIEADRYFAPGKRIMGGFDGLTIKRAPGSARVGVAWVAILVDESCDLHEDLVSDVLGPIDLLGATVPDTGAPSAYVTVAEDTDPAGAAPVGSFDCSGWSLLRVMIDGLSAAGNFTTADLVPWTDVTYAGGNWHEQGIDRISIPDSDTSGARFRIATVPVSGRGRMYFAVRNLLAVARTGLGLIVQGLK